MSSAKFRGQRVYGPQAPNWWFAYGVRASVGRILLSLYRVRVIDAHKVPSGGAILAGNHVSYLDPMLLWCCAPRHTHFVAKAELWDTSFLGWLLDHFWAFPVRRGTADREMISTATALLGDGELVGMFPEGTRKRGSETEELGEAQGGVSFIALRAGVPVVPVGFVGTDKALPAGAKLPRFPRVTIKFGDPVDPASFEGGRKERMEALTAELMTRISATRDQAKEA